MRKITNFGTTFVMIVILLSISIIISMNKFDTPNPIMSGIGLAKIMFTDAEIVQIREYPKIYLAKPDNAQQNLINFMKLRGYNYLDDERMAS
ncbi:MAG: hypothetical protein ACOYJ1_00260, partial [Peptococcales bacterium]